MVAAVVRRILKTRVTLGNIYCVLLNLFERLIFAMFKDSYPPNVQAVNIHILSSVHQLRLLLVVTSVPLPYLFGHCHDMYF